MSEFKAGQLVRVSVGAMRSGGFARSKAAGQLATVRLDGLDRDGDVVLLTKYGKVAWAMPEYVTLVGAEFAVGDRVRVVGTPEDIDAVKVPEPWIGKEGEVTGIVTGTAFPLKVLLDDRDSPEGFKFSEVERVEEQNNDTEDYPDEEGLAALRGETEDETVLRLGDRVRIIADIEGRGRVGSLVPTPDTIFAYRVEGVGHMGFVAVHEHDVEKVEPYYADEDEDTPDMVNHPPHYKFSNGAEVIDITEHLTFNGGNVVKYVARSTRRDGKVKGNVLEDLRKARRYLDREIERVEGKDA